MKRHERSNYFVVGEGILAQRGSEPVRLQPSTTAAARKFHFSRMGPKGDPIDPGLRALLAGAMTQPPAAGAPADSDIPAGYTYLGQFVDHDLTFDRTQALLGEQVSVEDLLQGRSPALDLDSLYGMGPGHPDGARFYRDGIRLKTGTTRPDGFFPGDAAAARALEGFDLPRAGVGSKISERRKPLIPDPRNDENLAVGQTHLAFVHFHNRVVDRLADRGTPSADLFGRAREAVTKHYQWMLRTDYLPRICDPAVVDDVFTHGRRFFEPAPQAGDYPTMPIEFSVAAFRFGHSMVREAYAWNRIFRPGSELGAPAGTLALLFNFSGTSGTLSADGNPGAPDSGSFETLPTSWIADFRRLFDFGASGHAGLAPPDAAELNRARRIDTLLVDPLKTLPLGAVDLRGPPGADIELNLAFRNLTRADMVQLASGQQMAQWMELPALSASELRDGQGGAQVASLPAAKLERLLRDTPLWFYVLREAEINGGRLAGVGARIVCETFHRAMEGSRHSILRDVAWQPSLGAVPGRFDMTDLLMVAFDGRPERLNPVG